ncbi:MAG: hypothetical protein A3C50_03265 [Candidatus Staskawiczbacteria bacterium RIFCSPHIGHO2_02_FULL_43_16]|uniref:Uncharacterized protein n=1 Tax=Candidatus Staskawiczbacteria bacterium RIFCSPHIGHO2_01_FULL_41_41 TaxID=1802203 RepID=A0A1G2HU74_9BACT|nr:MAG: hypothetical protein A2822_03135 [Candidatus Staskawiczbacteria bacterium RIFCSPHIGHO2_01_FULL_41_41]OGZ68720.1 MAG: hypothetical protein A3C50_03265 [Candidatus Staskawiczbacteria bacterium RIFCSPHIGHO2_02_FULL_43_16]OGZ75183.1 MAG: hypothetical protein A3A12_01190 [Candidatus Staskawiczbacteria bacterium RIFCSPLOWO2_01_FULL_43_17b]
MKTAATGRTVKGNFGYRNHKERPPGRSSFFIVSACQLSWPALRFHVGWDAWRPNRPAQRGRISGKIWVSRTDLAIKNFPAPFIPRYLNKYPWID